MRAHQRAFTALGAEVLIQQRNFLGQVAFLIGGRAEREGTIDREQADRYPVASTGSDLNGDPFIEFGRIGCKR